MHRTTFLTASLMLASAAYGLALDETETIRQSYGAAPKLEVRNINGSVRVTASNVAGIQIVATKKIHADDAAALSQARTEVRLDVRQTGDRVRVCIITPYEDCSETPNRVTCRQCERDYRVQFDLELQVPTNIALDLKTVNGSVSAVGTRGDFDAKTVNGSVTSDNVDGAGTAHTVNGGVKLSFAASPSHPIDAKTVNGGIEAAFPKSLNADLSFQTLSGSVFTSFPTTVVGGSGNLARHVNRRFAVRVGSGGPEHHFQTLSGDIQIAER